VKPPRLATNTLRLSGLAPIRTARVTGETAPYDQRLVEMAAYGLGLSLLQDTLTSQFTERELMNLHTWLNQITDARCRTATGTTLPLWFSLGLNAPGCRTTSGHR
jgi:hypothetical protein